MTSGTDRVEIRVDGSRVVADQAGSGEDAVLCVHGLASQRASLGPLVEVLADEGYLALAPDLRGHGDSEGPRGRLARERVLRDLEAWQRHLSDEDAQVRAIVGHSLGGLWTLAACGPLDPDAIALVAAPASVRGELSLAELVFYRLGQGLHRLVSPLGFEPRVPNSISLEDVLETEAAIESARRIDLLQPTLPLANVRELLALEGPRMAAQVDVPAIVARPVRDELVSEASTRELYDALPDAAWLELDGPHECFFEVQGRDNAERLAEALAEALAGACTAQG